MRKSSLVVAGITSLIAFTSVGAQEEPGEGEGGAGCFYCTTFLGSDNLYYHQDIWWSLNNPKVQGDYHFNITGYSCDDMLVTGWGHQPYASGEIPAALAAAREAAASGQDAVLLRAIQQHDEIRLNRSRNALQVTTPDGRFVVFHTPIEERRVKRVSEALHQLSRSGVSDAPPPRP